MVAEKRQGVSRIVQMIGTGYPLEDRGVSETEFSQQCIVESHGYLNYER